MPRSECGIIETENKVLPEFSGPEFSVAVWLHWRMNPEAAEFHVQTIQNCHTCISHSEHHEWPEGHNITAIYLNWPGHPSFPAISSSSLQLLWPFSPGFQVTDQPVLLLEIPTCRGWKNKRNHDGYQATICNFWHLKGWLKSLFFCDLTNKVENIINIQTFNILLQRRAFSMQQNMHYCFWSDIQYFLNVQFLNQFRKGFCHKNRHLDSLFEHHQSLSRGLEVFFPDRLSSSPSIWWPSYFPPLLGHTIIGANEERKNWNDKRWP